MITNDNSERKKISIKARNYVYHGERRAEQKSGRKIERTTKRRQYIRYFVQVVIRMLSEPYHVCYYCGRVLNSYRECSLDHCKPLRGVRTHTPDNTVICCHDCNKTKQDMTEEEFIKAYPLRTQALQLRMHES